MGAIASQEKETITLDSGEKFLVLKELPYSDMAKIIEALSEFRSEVDPYLDTPQDKLTPKQRDEQSTIRLKNLANETRFSGLVVNMTVLGWEGVKDDNGADIPFTKEALNRLKADSVRAISNQVMEKVARIEKKSK